MSGASDEFIREMLDENLFASPVHVDGNEWWTDFDPPFARSTVAAFERRGWIETRATEGRLAAHRWTKYGQAEILADRLRSLGYRVQRPHGVADKLKAKPAGQSPSPEAAP